MAKYDLIIEKIEELYDDETITMEEAVKLESLAFDKYVLEADEEDENEKKKMTAEQRKKILKIVAIATACIAASALIIRKLKNQKKVTSLNPLEQLKNKAEKILAEIKPLMKKEDLTLKEIKKLTDKYQEILTIHEKISAIGYKYGINIDRTQAHKTRVDILNKILSEQNKQVEKINKKILNS